MDREINPVAIKRFSRWRKDPILFTKDCFPGFYKDMTTQQADFLNSLRDLVWAKILVNGKRPHTPEQAELARKRGISVRSGKGTGKNAVISIGIFWFMTCFPKPRLACTAPTASQLSSNLWSELAKWLRWVDPKTKKESNPLRNYFELTSRSLFLKKYKGKEWFAFARTAQRNSSEDDQARTLQGLHADYLMVVVDEASGVPDAVMRPFDSTMTGLCNILIVMFNPNSRKGFAAAQHLDPVESEHWILKHWNAEDCEHIMADQIRYMKEKYGEHSDMYRVCVLGEFPRSESGSAIPWELVMDGVRAELESVDAPIHMGIDPGGGGDPTEICIRKGPKVVGFYEMDEVLADRVVDKTLDLVAKFEPDKIFVDANGLGHGIYSYLLKFLGGARVYSVKTQRTAFKDDQFVNLRDELIWRVREALEVGLDIPNDDGLINEMTSPGYTTVSNRVKVDPKDPKRSTNKLDSLALTFYHKDQYTMADHSKQKEKDRYWPFPDVDDTDPVSWMAF